MLGEYTNAAESCRMALRYDFEHRHALALQLVACFLAEETAEAERVKERIRQLKPQHVARRSLGARCGPYGVAVVVKRDYDPFCKFGSDCRRSCTFLL